MEMILPSRRIGGAFLCGLILATMCGIVLNSLDVFAETALVQPNGDAAVGGTAVGCTAGGNYECINDGVLIPDTPDTGTDYVSLQINQSDRYTLETIPQVDVVTAVDVNVYHVQVTSNLQLEVALQNSAGSVTYGTANLPITGSAQWNTANFSGLTLTQAQMDDLSVQLTCFRGGGGGQTNDCRAYAMYVDVTYDPTINVTVGTVGTQQNLDAGSLAQHVGGTFTFVENIGSSNVTSISVTETGTVNAANDLSNVALYYDLDTTTPFDCVSETYDGTEPQFGTTATGGFSGPNGSVTFTDSVSVTTSQALCVYVITDVEDTATPGETIEIEISDATSDVSIDTSFIEPTAPVAIAGTTIIQRTNLTQAGYHWRNDDGLEASATSATAGTANTTFDTAPREQTLRLRMAVSNEGNKTSDSAQYQLEYATKVTTCADATGWTNPATAGGNWNMSPTTNLTDSADTTNIVEATGGIPDPNTTFLTPNGGVRDTTNLTGGLVLTSTEFVELEYAIEATASAGDGVTYCFRVTNAGTPIDTYSIYPEATTFSDLTVASIGTQVATVDIPTANVHAGGAFTISDQTVGNHEVQSIKIRATGSVAVDTAVENVRLYYEFDTSVPRDCVSESYAGTEAQYGSAVTNLSGGVGTFTDTSIFVDPSQTLCLYVVYDVTNAAVNDSTIDWQIDNPASDVVVDAGDIGPSSLVAIADETRFIEVLISQTGYHWRENNGSETGATSATGGLENTTLAQQRTESPIRLRVAVANKGGKDDVASQYRLESARRISTCSTVSNWTDVGAAGGAWNMSDSANLTNGADTTNIATSTGGVSDPTVTFLTPNGGVRDTTSQTGNITLTAHTFVELEYSIEATPNAVEGATYCFRITKAGTALPTYDIYPQAQIKEATDFLIQRGFVDIAGTSATLTAGTDYEAPAASTGAFVRITNTLNTGAGSGTTGNADDVTVYVSNPNNITSNITFTRPAGATGQTRVAWEIIEYVGAPGGQNEIIVRQQDALTYGTAATTVTTPTVSGIVDDAQVAVFVTGQLNPDTGTNYPLGLSTAAWNGGTDTATFTRGLSGNAAGVSYAVVEFTGSNWLVQRNEHTYSAAGATETEAITAVNSLARAFIHTQKRMGANQTTHGDFGHQVRLSGIGQLSYTLDITATTPSSHTSVAWVIENTQVAGNRMEVTRSNGSQSSGANPTLLNVNIGKTLSDVEVASIFMNNSGTETGGQGANSFPEPMMSARIISPTQYQLYIADTDDSRSWRTEIVEWPTAARTFTQNYYRFYVDNDALTPSDPWPAGVANVGDNSAITLADQPVGLGQKVRLRMSVEVNAAGSPPGLDAFTLQYAERVTTCSAVSAWNNVEGTGGSSVWRGATSSVTTGTALSTDPPAGGDLLLPVSNVAATYEEGGTSAFTPYQVDPGENMEFDWIIQHNGAKDKTSYCFRMIESNELEFLAYNFYPTLLTAAYEPVLSNWRFYDDIANITPTSPLAAENETPVGIDNTNTVKLRTTLRETAGADGQDVKFKVQFSEYADFSRGVEDVVPLATCTESALWCYADGGGIDNQQIVSALISDADSCVSGSGAGCGTHNEGISTTTATVDHQAFTTAEFEFTLQNAGARTNAVYYFRLYDINEDRVVAASSSYPSVTAASSSLSFQIAGVPAGTSVAAVTTGATTTSDGVTFSNIPIGQPYAVAQTFTIDTNATEGYQVFVMSDQALTNSYGHTIDAVSSSNASPSGWATACATVTNGCFGYHSTDAVLANSSGRFAPDDSYAAFTTLPEEVFFSTIPGTDVHNLVYQVEIDDLQPAGVYNTNISFIVVPVF